MAHKATELRRAVEAVLEGFGATDIRHSDTRRHQRTDWTLDGRPGYLVYAKTASDHRTRMNTLCQVKRIARGLVGR